MAWWNPFKSCGDYCITIEAPEGMELVGLFDSRKDAEAWAKKWTDKHGETRGRCYVKPIVDAKKHLASG